MLKVIKKIVDGNFTYSIMATTENPNEEKWVQINNHVTSSNSVLVPISALKKLAL